MRACPLFIFSRISTWIRILRRLSPAPYATEWTRGARVCVCVVCASVRCMRKSGLPLGSTTAPNTVLYVYISEPIFASFFPWIRFHLVLYAWQTFASSKCHHISLHTFCTQNALCEPKCSALGDRQSCGHIDRIYHSIHVSIHILMPNGSQLSVVVILHATTRPRPRTYWIFSRKKMQVLCGKNRYSKSWLVISPYPPYFMYCIIFYTIRYVRYGYTHLTVSTATATLSTAAMSYM